MESAFSSTFTNVLSARESATVVDLSAAAATDASADPKSSTRDIDQFSALELDFETRNWRAARARFQTQSKHDMDRVNEFLSQHESPQQAKEFCVSAQGKASKQYAQAVGGVLSKIETFMKVGDVAMKGAPESVGLAWMGIRLCMHSVQDDFATFNLFSGAASDIIGILLSCRAYGKMYGGDGGQKGSEDFKELHQKVVDYIPKIYSDVLEFSYQMRKHMGRNVALRLAKGLLSSAVNKFKGMIDGIRFSEQTMSKYAQQATQQLTIFYEELGLQKQDYVIGSQQVMLSEVAAIKGILSESARGQKMFEDHIKELENEKKHMKKKTPRDEAKEKFEANKIKLKPTSSEDALDRGKKIRSAGTCEWVFGLDPYKEWMNSDKSRILWIQGDGGMGKSVLMATIIDQLQRESKEVSNTAVQYSICSDTELTAQIQNQLIYGLYELADDSASPETLEKANNIVEKFLSSDSPTQATGSKKSETTSFKETYRELIRVTEKRINLVIDALDECKDRQPSKFLKDLKELTGHSEGPEYHLNVILCSRPEIDILEEMKETDTIKIKDHNGPDIELDAKAKLEALPGLSAPERTLACEAIVKKAQGLFRCVDPAIDFLKRPWKRPLEQALEKLPDGLTNSYQQIFRQTDPQYLDLLKTALHWCILGKRKPTIAEVMDDYTCAYEQDDGSDINPYDQLIDPTTPSETKLLIHNQIREAGSNTFLEIESDQQVVKTRHATVTDFFLPAASPLAPAHGHDQEHLCPECKLKVNSNQTWTLSKKEGHLRMAITIFKHLNSALFRKRYLTEEPKSGEEDENAEKQSSAENENTTKAETDDAEKEPPTDVLEKVDSELPNGNIQNQPQDQSGEPKQKPIADDNLNADGEQAGETDANGIPTGDDTDNHDGESANDASAAKSTLLEAAEADEDEDNAYLQDERSVRSDEDENEPEQSTTDGKSRYEVVHWPQHLQEAEALWSSDEKKNHPLWKELWDLVLTFLCDSPGPFHVWQMKYGELPDDIWGVKDDEILTPLHVAAAYGLTALCEILIQRGESVAAVTSNGCSVLWFATNHSVELLKLLLENGADPNFFKETLPPFHRLLYLSQPIEKIRLMIDFKADCKLHSEWEMTAVHWCGGWCQDPEILRLLIAHGADINAVDDMGETGLHKLMWQYETPKDLLEEFLKAGANVNIEDKEGQQPLYEVCSQGSEEGCRMLLEHGADVEHADTDGITAMHAAANNGSWDCEKLLIEWKASLTRTDKQSRTPFWHACSNGYSDSAKLIMEAAHAQGCDDIITMAANDGRTPLTKASGRGHLEVVRAILENPNIEVDINAVEGVLKRTALHWAAKNGRTQVVSLLLEKGADPAIQDINGRTALNLSAVGWLRDKQSQREPVILALIDRDSTAAAQDTNLMTNAAIHGSIKVIEKLIDNGADPTKQDEHGWTPLQLARQYNHEDAAAVLAKRGAVVGSQPSRWKTDFSVIKISEDGKSIENTDKSDDGRTVLTNHPIPAGIPSFYFEITLSSTTLPTSTLAIGLVTQPALLEDCYPGWYNPLARSWGYHSDDGRLWSKNPINDSWQQPFGKDETVGCGVVYGEDGIEGKIFFTKGGKSLGWAFESGVVGRLYPAIGVSEILGCTANWGEDLKERPFYWKPGNAKRFGAEDVDVVFKEEAVEKATVDGKLEDALVR